MNKSIVILVTAMEHVLFAKRLINQAKERGCVLYLVTPHAALFRRLRYDTQIAGRAVLITAQSGADKQDSDCFRHAVEVLTGHFTAQGAVCLAGHVRQTLDKLDGQRLQCLLLFNGCKTVDLAAKAWAQQKNIPYLIVEYANLPGKTFVDSAGGNAYSTLFREPQLLDELYRRDSHTLDHEYASWREDYLQAKETGHRVLQAGDGHKQLNRLSLLERLSDRVHLARLLAQPLYPLEAVTRRAATMRTSLHCQPVAIPYDEVPETSLPTLDYVFFPLQVSSDTQLLLHGGGYDNVSGVRKAWKIAQKMQAELLVKPHPAETSQSSLAAVAAWQRKLGFRLVTGNTFQLIKHARKVVTINSTAGLEAKIAGVETVFLGRSFYQQFNETRIKAYVLRYLCSFDYFDYHSGLSAEQWDDLMSRLAPAPKGA